jgi:hypothetical protein
MPSNIRSKVANATQGNCASLMATCWNTPSMDRSPTELCRPSKALCCDSSLDGHLEQGELVGHERIAVDEMLAVAEIAIVWEPSEKSNRVLKLLTSRS